MLTIANVSKSYGPRTLFAEVSLNIARTDRLGLVGAHRARQTTPINKIHDKDKPDERRLGG
ncbi:MAG: hypothetical protein ACK47U_06160, partial [Verrucomicrobiota bacterium]